MSATASPPAALDRAGRKACWEARDAFFQCLNIHNIAVPPEGGSKAKGSDVCVAERERYERDCPKSWTDYFSKRRVLEVRRAMTEDAARKSQEETQRAQR
ncbi:hypothetical protein NliqN6_6565 [Naganishia liquefaciens]|uniref:Cytochrome c oxidase assembly factor 6 n=1 Tax=Naganishia liquefaciens TaxID=104408 RepID=A0A8H3TZW7_9TREE|nr:hypothetical protein NliqN6_6565 [Naganishia liquefaciens]